jgi:DNA-binding beta-propeller fold protein YncE
MDQGNVKSARWGAATLTCALLLLAATSRRGAGGAHTSVLDPVADIPLSGPATRFDYQSIDTTTNRLYISHMGAGTLLVFDLETRQLLRTVTGLPRVTGVWCVPALKKMYVSVPGHEQVFILDTSSLEVISSAGPIGFPDGIADAPAGKKIYVSDESGGGELVIDEVTNQVVRQIDLSGEAGNTLYDPGSGHVLVAVQSHNELVEIDPQLDHVVARHALPGSAHPHGMSLDAADRLLFVASEESGVLQTVDLATWQAIDRQVVGKEPDVLAFDPAWRRLYVAAESGAVSVFTLRKRKLVSDGQIKMPHAHTVAVDPRTHLVYFPLQDVDGHPALRIMSGRKP